MQFTAAKALAIMAFLIYTIASPVADVKRSIPALQGWSEKNFKGTSEYLTFCAPGFCCFPSKTALNGSAVSVVTKVESLSLMYAHVMLKNTSNVFLWENSECKGRPVAAFNAFKGDKDLGIKAVVGSFMY